MFKDINLHFWRGKLRGYFSWLFIAAILFSVRGFPEFDGIFVIFLGAALRFWSSGYLDKEGRLTVSGPYAYSRNPLYVGTILMAVGVVATQDAWWLLIPLVLGFAFIFTPLVIAEEKVLAEKFGEQFTKYVANVGRFVPKLKGPYVLEAAHPRVNTQSFSMETLKKNKGFEPIWAAIGIVGILSLVSYLRQYFHF